MRNQVCIYFIPYICLKSKIKYFTMLSFAKNYLNVTRWALLTANQIFDAKPIEYFFDLGHVTYDSYVKWNLIISTDYPIMKKTILTLYNFFSSLSHFDKLMSTQNVIVLL